MERITSFLLLFIICSCEPVLHNDCKHFIKSLDKNTEYLSRYQNIVFVGDLHETDTNRIEMLKIQELKNIFNAKNNTINLINNDSEQDLLNLYSSFVKRIAKNVPKENKKEIISLSDDLISDISSCKCFEESKEVIIKHYIHMIVEQALHFNYKDVNANY